LQRRASLSRATHGSQWRSRSATSCPAWRDQPAEESARGSAACLGARKICSGCVRTTVPLEKKEKGVSGMFRSGRSRRSMLAALQCKGRAFAAQRQAMAAEHECSIESTAREPTSVCIKQPELNRQKTAHGAHVFAPAIRLRASRRSARRRCARARCCCHACPLHHSTGHTSKGNSHFGG
jgi:hypothetical protein